ncbi:MAG: hypothetical protein HZA17_08295 [Nitrospirae bacterium]|nr:hypothetical protein [Nitrospirota bacterium]
MKAVIDTNIWISFLIGKLLAWLDDYILVGFREFENIIKEAIKKGKS